MQQLTRSSVDPNDPNDKARFFIELMGDLVQNSKGEPELHQQDVKVRDMLVAYIGDPHSRSQQHKLLHVVQNYLLPKMPIYKEKRAHPDFLEAVNVTLRWLTAKRETPRLLELKLNEDAGSLCQALGFAIYNVSLNFKTKSLSPDHTYDPKLNNKFKKCKEKLIKLNFDSEKNKEKIDEIKLDIQNIEGIVKAKKVHLLDRSSEGNNYIDIPDSSSTESPAHEFQDIQDYLDSDPDGVLQAIPKLGKACNCHAIWQLKSKEPKLSFKEIANRLGVKAHNTPRKLWHSRCLPCIKQLKETLKDR